MPGGPPSVGADEQHRRGLTAQAYWPMLVPGRGLWHWGDPEEARAAALTPSSGGWPRAAAPQALP
jgi:hypothetical protein